MAPKSDSTQSLLYLHLITLIKLQGPSKRLEECVKPDTFTKPNRQAFEMVMHFLIQCYNAKLCQSAFTCWPITERKTQERVFRREVVEAVKKIASLEPDVALPPFSNSFLSTPGGARLENFLCSLAYLALKKVVERRANRPVPNPPRGLDPRTCAAIAASRYEAQLKILQRQIDRFVMLVRRCAEEALSLSERLASNQRKIKETRELVNEMQVTEEPFESIFNNEVEAELRDRIQKSQRSLKLIQDHEKRFAECENLARMVAENDQPAVVLESDTQLSIAVLLRKTADAVESLSTRMGPTTDPDVLLQLMEIADELAGISLVMDRTLTSAMELAAIPSVSNHRSEPSNGHAATPERFRFAFKQLEDAAHQTPPLVLRPANYNRHCLTITGDTESPPITSIADLLCYKRTAGKTSNELDKNRGATISQVSSKLPICTPARPRSSIPVTSLKSSNTFLEIANENKVETPLPCEAKPKPQDSPPACVRSSEVTGSKEERDSDPVPPISSDPATGASVEDILDLAVSMLRQQPSDDDGVKEETAVEVFPLTNGNPLSLLDFPDSDTLLKKDEGPEIEISLNRRRRSTLDLMQRLLPVVPDFDNYEPVTIDQEKEPDEWKDSDSELELTLDSD